VFLQNVGIYLWIYMVWKPQILQTLTPHTVVFWNVAY
jgi:hypothetical protein